MRLEIREIVILDLDDADAGSDNGVDLIGVVSVLCEVVKCCGGFACCNVCPMPLAPLVQEATQSSVCNQKPTYLVLQITDPAKIYALSFIVEG